MGVFHGPRHCVLLFCMLISHNGVPLSPHFWSSCLTVGFFNWWWWWQYCSPQTHSPLLPLSSPQRMFYLCYSLWCRSSAWVSLVILLCCCGKWLNKLFPALGEFILEKSGLSYSQYHIYWAIELQVAKEKTRPDQPGAARYQVLGPGAVTERMFLSLLCFFAPMLRAALFVYTW